MLQAPIALVYSLPNFSKIKKLIAFCSGVNICVALSAANGSKTAVETFHADIVLM